jgi:hypothetical protein
MIARKARGRKKKRGGGAGQTNINSNDANSRHSTGLATIFMETDRRQIRK